MEHTDINAEVINSAFINKIEQGFVKEAEEAGSAYIRQKLYEEGFTRKILTPQTKTAEDLDPNLDNDKPKIRVEIEPDAPAATFVAFKGTGDRRYFEGKRFDVPFGKIESERENKSKFELMTIRMPIMEWLKRNQVKSIQQQEDESFIETVKANIAMDTAKREVVCGSSLSFKDSFLEGVKCLNRLRLPTGVILMNANTYIDSSKLKMEEIGDDSQARRFREGLANEGTFMGYKVLTTIKDDLVPDSEMYFFTPEMYFGKFYLLQDATLFIKTEADMFSFHTYEAPGIGIGNTNAAIRIKM